MPPSDDAVPPSVFHYTSAQGLIGILDRRQLWMTDIEFLNDEQEMRFAIDHLRSATIAKREEVEALDPNDPATMEQWGYYRSLQDVLDSRFPQVGGARVPWERRPYVTCFCGDGDLLSMWRAYAGGAGFAIEFDTEILLDALGPSPSQGDLTDDEFTSLTNVNFGVDARFESIQYGVEGIREALRFLIDRDEAAEVPPPPWTDAHPIDRVIPHIARTKHPAFIEEREVRLLAFPTGDLSPRPELRAGRGHLVPYFPIEFPHQAVRSVRVGPSPNRGRDQLALERRLSSARGEFGHVAVETSTAPLLF